MPRINRTQHRANTLRADVQPEAFINPATNNINAPLSILTEQETAEPLSPVNTSAGHESNDITPETVLQADIISEGDQVTADITSASAGNMLSFYVYQGTTKFEIKTPVTDYSAQQVIGCCVSAFYRWVKLYRTFKCKGGLKFREPIGFRFTIAGNLWDTGLMSMTFQEQLKLTNTPQGRISFAQKLYVLYMDSTTPVIPVSFDDYMDKLRRELPAKPKARALPASSTQYSAATA